MQTKRIETYFSLCVTVSWSMRRLDRLWRAMRRCSVLCAVFSGYAPSSSSMGRLFRLCAVFQGYVLPTHSMYLHHVLMFRQQF